MSASLARCKPWHAERGLLYPWERMLTIREAAEKTGHSPHKIRRLIKAVADQPTHADRHLVEPTPEYVERMTAEGVQFTWRIDEELVRRELGETATEPNEERVAGDARVGESPE